MEKSNTRRPKPLPSMSKKKNDLPVRAQRIKDNKPTRLPPKSVRIKKLNVMTSKKSSDHVVASADAGHAHNPLQTIPVDRNEITENATNFNTMEPPTQLAEVEPFPSRESASASNGPSQIYPANDPAHCTGFLGNVQEVNNIDNERVKKKLQQKHYMEQLQEQIREKERLKQQEKMRTTAIQAKGDIFQTVKVGEPWLNKRQLSVDSKPFIAEAIQKPQESPEPIRNNERGLPSITGSHRAYVPNRIEAHIEGSGSIFVRDEKQILKNKREQEKNEMKRILEEQIAEKKRRQEDEKRKQAQEDLKFERTMSDFRQTPETRFGQTLKEMPKTPAIQELPREETPKCETPIKEEENPVEFEETPQKEISNIGRNQIDERWELLKSQIQVLNEEKKLLLNQLENKDKIIKEMSNTRYIPSTNKVAPMKHKVIGSADSKKKSERRRKEEQFAQAVLIKEKLSEIDKKIEAARERVRFMKSKKVKSGPDIENISIPIRPPRLPIMPKINESSRKSIEIPQQNSVAVPQDPAFNLDQKGESHWVYPGADGTYTFPLEKFGPAEVATPHTGITTESADSKELEDLLKGFGKFMGREDSLTPLTMSPKDSMGNIYSSKNWTQYNQKPGYASNIANIMKTTNVLKSPNLENPAGNLIEQSTLLGLSKAHHGGFPRDVFQVKPKRPVPY